MNFPRLMTGLALAVCLAAPYACAQSPSPAAPAPATAAPKDENAPREINAQTALYRLLQGNTRYCSGKASNANQGAFARSKAAMREYPWAIVLTCSDSRVPPEIIFDQGLGDIVVVREWGMYTGDATIGSIEHALEDHGPPLIVVLGHQRCGAVRNAVEGHLGNGPQTKIIRAILPAVAVARTKSKRELLDQAVRENIRRVAHRLLESPLIAERVKEGKLRVVPAYYSLDTGKVEIMHMK